MTVRLDAEIASATDPLERDCRRAEKAAYLARIGRAEDARAALDALHARRDDRPHARLSAALNLAEGIAAQARGDAEAARDRLLRARALAAAVALTPVQALAAAWLAHLGAWRGDAPALGADAALALHLAAPDDHATRARVGLAVAHAAHRAGRLDRALPWYAQARTHALADADEAGIGDLMHGMAWLRVEQCRADALDAAGPFRDGHHAGLAVESIAHFEARVGAPTRPVPVALLRARWLTAVGRWHDALALYDAGAAAPHGDAAWHADALAERAWCRIGAGRPDEAAADAAAAAARLGAGPRAPGEGASTHERLARVYGALHDAGRAAHHAALARSAWRVDAALRAALLACVDAVERAGHATASTPAAARPA